MKISSKIIEFKFEKPLKLNYVENFFSKNNINALRWAIISKNESALTIAYAHFE